MGGRGLEWKWAGLWVESGRSLGKGVRFDKGAWLSENGRRALG